MQKGQAVPVLLKTPFSGSQFNPCSLRKGLIRDNTSFAVNPVITPIGMDPASRYGNIAATLGCM